MMRERRNTERTSSGVALVATSKSLGANAQQQVAHGAAHHEGREARALQLLAGAPRALADVLARDGVLVLAVDDGPRVLVGDALAPAEELVDVALDHAAAR